MRRSAVEVFGQGPGGRWQGVGRARIGRKRGRVVVLVELEAAPLSGRLCVPMADLQVLAEDEAQRRAARPGVAEHARPLQPPRGRPVKPPMAGVVLLLAAALTSCAGLPAELSRNVTLQPGGAALQVTVAGRLDPAQHVPVLQRAAEGVPCVAPRFLVASWAFTAADDPVKTTVSGALVCEGGGS